MLTAFVGYVNKKYVLFLVCMLGLVSKFFMLDTTEDVMGAIKGSDIALVLILVLLPIVYDRNKDLFSIHGDTLARWTYIFLSFYVIEMIITVIVGPGYERSILPFQIVLILVFLVGIAQILEDQILLSFKKFKKILICTSISAILAVILLYVFVPTYAEIASAIALSLPHVVEFILLYHYAKKSIDIKFPFAEFFKILLSCIPIIAICLICRQFTSGSFVTLTVAGVTSVLYYFITHYFLLRNEFLRSQLPFRNIIK